MIVPLGSRIFVRPLSRPTQTSGGLHLPDVANDLPDTMGVVVAVGDKVENVLVGEQVIFSAYVGQEVYFDDEKHIVIDSDDIVAVVTADLTECPFCRRELEAVHA